MRICLTTTVMRSHGGISRYVMELSKRLVKEHEIHILTGKKEVGISGVKVHMAPTIFSPVSLRVASNTLSNTLISSHLKKKCVVDLIHGQGAEVIGPDVITAHSCHKAAAEQQMKERGGRYQMLKPFEPRNNIVLAIEKYNYRKRKYRKAISVSEGVKRELMTIYKVPDEDVVVIPNGVDLEEFTPENRGKYQKPVREELGVEGEDIILLITAWEFNRKGVRYIIESLPELPKQVKLVVVGEDDKKPYLTHAEKAGVKKRVFFTGASKDVKRYYAASDIFVFPTSYEAFSLSTLEAVASGLPLVTTKVNGTEELVKDGRNGFFVERDGKDIADKIKKVIDYGIGKMGSNARKTAMDYSWDKVAEKTSNVYKELE
ncbi:MAG: glycosyltransferase family 4 protein [Candidatus Altiarchaeota archaeon]|nr:glycosyltransferase family 4 protein [Candidatus Altiarchaeota archaeon]